MVHADLIWSTANDCHSLHDNDQATINSLCRSILVPNPVQIYTSAEPSTDSSFAFLPRSIGPHSRHLLCQESASGLVVITPVAFFFFPPSQCRPPHKIINVMIVVAQQRKKKMCKKSCDSRWDNAEITLSSPLQYWQHSYRNSYSLIQNI